MSPWKTALLGDVTEPVQTWNPASSMPRRNVHLHRPHRRGPRCVSRLLVPAAFIVRTLLAVPGNL